MRVADGIYRLLHCSPKNTIASVGSEVAAEYSASDRRAAYAHGGEGTRGESAWLRRQRSCAGSGHPSDAALQRRSDGRLSQPNTARAVAGECSSCCHGPQHLHAMLRHAPRGGTCGLCSVLHEIGCSVERALPSSLITSPRRWSANTRSNSRRWASRRSAALASLRPCRWWRWMALSTVALSPGFPV